MQLGERTRVCSRLAVAPRNSAVDKLRSVCVQTWPLTDRVDRSSLRVVDDDATTGSATGVHALPAVIRSRRTRRDPMRATATAIALTISLLACENAEEEGRKAAQAR